ncbi:MAG: CBS domain-containing protein [Candidatus Binatia bacterium]
MYRFLEARVEDYMTRAVMTVSPDMAVRELEQLFTQHDFNGFPVVADGALIGLVTKFDVLKVFVFTPHTVVPQYDQLARRTATEVMTRDVITFAPETPLTRVLQTLIDARVKSFPVVEHGRLIGIIAREDIVRALRDAATAAPG